MGHDAWYIPPEVGLRISDDTAAVMSPKLYREFGVAYNTKLSEAFGGIVVHSCGDLQPVLPVMMGTPGLQGIDLTMPPNPNWNVIKDAAAGKTALNLRHYFWNHPQKDTRFGGIYPVSHRLFWQTRHFHSDCNAFSFGSKPIGYWGRNFTAY